MMARLFLISLVAAVFGGALIGLGVFAVPTADPVARGACILAGGIIAGLGANLALWTWYERYGRHW